MNHPALVYTITELCIDWFKLSEKDPEEWPHFSHHVDELITTYMKEHHGNEMVS